WQELFFAKRYSEIDLSDNPDFAALAEVFGIRARRIDRRDQVEDALVDLLAQPGPALLHVAIDIRANVWPLVPPNTANGTMLDSNPADQDAAESNATQTRTESPHALPA
ncbi:MAG TPA: thiamine pyrophosphate-dependent enzyme, partial [Pseudoxanthomonas sp.]|nr:thiamine pyrophosphate-dependent enzyme [Pseudoxanthomonas sp.]